MLSEIKNFHSIFKNKPPGKIDDRIVAQELGDRINAGTQLWIFFNLCEQDLPGCCSICFSAVGILERLTAIKFIRRSERTRLHHVKDLLNVHHTAL
jgi:hypothetical protein